MEAAVKKRNEPVLSIEFSSQSTQELLGRQSVRTTFKLSERSIDALSILANQLGIKQKSLFDHLIDDDSALRVVAKEAEQYEAPEQRVPKTYVISRRTLKNLEKVSNKYQTPRDALVELSIERILPLISREKKKHEERKKLLKKMQTLLESSNELFDMAGETLDHDDPVYRRIYQMMKTVNSCCDEVRSCVERGRKIENF